MDNTITLYFKWHSATPDPRQFNQQRQIMYPFANKDEEYLTTVIAIQIPLKGEFVFNASEILAAQLSSDETTPDPILTPAGMFLAISMLEKPFAEVGVKVEDEKKKLDDEWGDDEDDGWGDSKSEDEEKHPWDTKAEADPLPDDTPQPTESVVESKADDAWEDVIAVDEIKVEDEAQTDDDTPDWSAEETWETKPKGDK